jgi:hypothetical protein
MHSTTASKSYPRRTAYVNARRTQAVIVPVRKTKEERCFSSLSMIENEALRMILVRYVILNPSAVTLNEVKSLRVNSVKDLSQKLRRRSFMSGQSD